MFAVLGFGVYTNCMQGSFDGVLSRCFSYFCLVQSAFTRLGFRGSGFSALTPSGSTARGFAISLAKEAPRYKQQRRLTEPNMKKN